MLTLDLPPELESELAAEAARFQVSLAEYVLRLLATGRTAISKPQNGAELMAYWESAGLVGTRQDIVDSASHARKLREFAERRERS